MWLLALPARLASLGERGLSDYMARRSEERRWSAGDQAEHSGFNFRVVRGSKSADDLRLEVLAMGRWRPVRMSLGFFLADFFYENEDVLYPREPHDPARCLKPGCDGSKHRGGQKYIGELRKAGRQGWQATDAFLEAERAEQRIFEDATEFIAGEDDRDG